jgi:hypothetical protein
MITRATRPSVAPAPTRRAPRARVRGVCGLVAAVALAASVLGCRDVSRFSTNDDHHYEGSIVQGSFVRAGLEGDARMCLSLDADHLQDTPGTITTLDGRFRGTPLRPIPQLWHDPLSTLSFGDGRTRNLLYVAAAHAPADASSSAVEESDVMVFLSLMQSGDVELRLVRGAPPASTDVAEAGATAGAPSASANLFGVFTLRREEGSCSF